MKKSVLMKTLMAAAMVISVAGCQKKEAEQPQETDKVLYALEEKVYEYGKDEVILEAEYFVDEELMKEEDIQKVTITSELIEDEEIIKKDENRYVFDEKTHAVITKGKECLDVGEYKVTLEYEKETADVKVKVVDEADAKKAKEEAEKANEAKKDENKEAAKEDKSGGSQSSNQPSSKPSSSQNGGSSQGGSSGSSGNTSQSHTHSYDIPVTKVVHHDAVTHQEQRLVSDAWDEPIYTSSGRIQCHGCGNLFYTTSEWDAHALYMEDNNNDWSHGSYSVVPVQVIAGYEHHAAVYETITVTDKAAWDETVTTGYKCSCGAVR